MSRSIAATSTETMTTTSHTNPINLAGGGTFTVSGTLSLPNPYDGCLIDETTNLVYLPTSDGSPRRAMDGDQSQSGGRVFGPWSLQFKIPANVINPNDTLFMYAYDTVTGAGCQATYQDANARDSSKCAAPKSAAAPVITINFTTAPPATGAHCINGLVEHKTPPTKGFVFLIRWKKGSPIPKPLLFPLSSTDTQTPFNFPITTMEDWDLVSVNVVAEGHEKKNTVRPYVIKPPPKHKKK
jgi:hypothetical protein